MSWYDEPDPYHEPDPEERDEEAYAEGLRDEAEYELWLACALAKGIS